MRKLVTLRTVNEIKPIPEADLIEVVMVDGWQMVCQKGIHSVGDQVLYFEIDSFLPESDPRFESFMKFGIRTFNEQKGHRVKTVKLRGTYSQGILMPISEFPEIMDPQFDTDYSENIGVVKWEKSEATGYTGDQKGFFPDFLQKSDQERIQNLYNKFTDSEKENEFVGTLKMDGSSVTVYCKVDQVLGIPAFGICSRNQELKLADPSTPIADRGKFEQGVVKSRLLEKTHDIYKITGMEVAIQGELVGPGIQGNFEKLDHYRVFVYNIFDIQTRKFLSYESFNHLCESFDIETVPVIFEKQQILKEPLEAILQMADGKGYLASYREGIVWKQIDGKTQFKAISNRYLSKEKD
jgi:RNA ligase (TIGR02306 family)